MYIMYILYIYIYHVATTYCSNPYQIGAKTKEV